MKNKFSSVLLILHLLMLADASCMAVLMRHSSNSVVMISLTVTFVLLAACIVVFLLYSGSSIRHISKMNTHLESSAAEYMHSLPAPVAVIDQEDRLVWYNAAFAVEIGLGQDVFGIALSDVIELDKEKMSEEGSAQCSIKEKIYTVSSEKFEKTEIAFTVLYFRDDTIYHTLKKQVDDTHPNVIAITIDNYDDIMQNAKETEKAQASVETEKLIENFMSGTSGIVKRNSANSFYAVIENRHLERIIEEKFKILDQARSIKIAGKYPLTFSIGVGQGAESLSESETIAKQCLEMALGRGGDQAVIKNESGYRFFGGVSKGVEKRSHAKTRFVSNALQDFIKNAGRVYIMGHRFGDLDSVGASCGIAGAVRLLGKEVRIAVDREKNLASNLIDFIEDQTDNFLFVPPSLAEAEITEDDLLIVVDTHNKDFLESFALYEKAKTVVVIDHHRKNINFIDNAVIFHHEPYASSASEMVTEVLQYFKFDPESRYPACFAEALLAGIMLDTKNFVMRTGVRTFEAAAYLKKLGADTVAVKGLFSSSIDSYKRRSQIVASAKVHQKCAIAAADFNSDDIRIVAPQAADELLGITDVDASFVLFKLGNTVNISARSLGALNVQVIMEKLGGGGHQTMAATQMENSSVQDAVKALIKAIDDYTSGN